MISGLPTVGFQQVQHDGALLADDDAAVLKERQPAHRAELPSETEIRDYV